MMIFTALGVILFLILYASSADAVLWEEVQVDVSPTPRRSHAMAYDADNEVVVLFGGFGNGTHLNDTWVFDPKKNSWMNMEPKSSPLPRAAATLVYDEERKNFILFGGFGDAHEVVFNDTWLYDYSSNTWKQLKPNFGQEIGPTDSPPPRASYGMDYDSKRKVMVMFGGFTESDYYNELWIYDPETNSWEQKIQTEAPHVRGAPGFVYDKKNDVFLLFGGFSEIGFFNDTWIYDPKDNSWREADQSVTPPPVRTRMVYDENNEVAIFFGGDFVAFGIIPDEESVPKPYSKTWAYGSDSNRWGQLITQNDPSPRGLSGVVIDLHRNSLILFGGTDTMIDDVNFLGNEFSDTWILPLEDISLDSLILDPPGSSAPDLFPIIILAVGVAVISIFLVMRVKKRKVQRRLRR